MKQIQAIIFICITLLSGTSYSQDEPAKAAEAEQITQLIITLAKLTDMADACGEHMNYFGKKALEGAVCKEFKQEFADHWESREALQFEVADYSYQLETGQFVCDRCKLMLQRVEELRITITYYLDYMDFMAEF